MACSVGVGVVVGADGVIGMLLPSFLFLSLRLLLCLFFPLRCLRHANDSTTFWHFRAELEWTTDRHRPERLRQDAALV